MALIRAGSGGQTVVEFPIGKRVGRFEDATAVRVAPDGECVVIVHYNTTAYAYLTLVKKDGTATRIATFKSPTINAVPGWSPEGREVWISSLVGEERTIYAFDRQGSRRVVTTLAGISELQSISRQGCVLIDMIDQRFGSMALAPGATEDADTSLTDEYALYSPMGADGRTYVYTTFNADLPVTFIRNLSDRQAVRLCDGITGGHISRRFALGTGHTAAAEASMFLVPTGAGWK